MAQAARARELGAWEFFCRAVLPCTFGFKAWITRFSDEMDPTLRHRIARYVAATEEETKS